jgi:2-polyprenyl-3-methyl-5-hydroxy-6-metoxy-1,4-benzoquinol methylase
MHKNKIERILEQETIRLCEMYNLPCEYAMLSLSRQSTSFAMLMDIDPKVFEGKTVLEIGPYRTATAFLYRRLGASKIRVIDGDISDLDIMNEIYKAEKVDFFRLNLSGAANFDSLSIPADNDVVICMESLEHFNFNPIPFLRWLRSLISPGGMLFLTVPNQAMLLNRARLLVGKSIATPVNYFFEQMEPGNTKAHGVHWREYTLEDFGSLLSYCGFKEKKNGYVGMQDFKQKKGAIKNIGRKILSYHSTILYLGSPVTLE